ncbi:MAG: hypothetical protein KDD94_10520, partial [Calditrichaeota bacterium]|nr:hypothetical protein [Calditrichota bacterium]
MLLVLITLISLQDIPFWLEVHLTDENRDYVLSEIDELQTAKFDFKLLSLKQLQSELNFIPDSLLRQYRQSPDKLHYTDRQFISSFDLNFSQVNSSNYSILRSSTSTDPDREKYLGNGTVFKSFHRLQYQSITLDYSQIKLNHEKFASHHLFLLNYRFGWLNLFAGQFSLTGFQTLFFARPFGKRFVANQRLGRPASFSAHAQQSINKQNSLNGLAASSNFADHRFALVYGQQEHLVSFKYDHFESFNYYFPFDRQSSIDSRTRIKETNLLLFSDLQLDKSYSLQLNYQLFALTEPFIKVSDYSPVSIKNENYFSIEHRLEFDNTRFQLIHAHQLGKRYAYELSMSTDFDDTGFDAAYFYYDYNYYNPHSCGFMDGADPAWNRYGYFFQLSQKLNSTSRIYLALLADSEIRSLSFENFPMQSRRLESGIEWRFSPHHLSLVYSQSASSSKIKIQHRYAIDSRQSVKQLHTIYQDGSYYSQSVFI